MLCCDTHRFFDYFVCIDVAISFLKQVFEWYDISKNLAWKLVCQFVHMYYDKKYKKQWHYSEMLYHSPAKSPEKGTEFETEKIHTLHT